MPLADNTHLLHKGQIAAQLTSSLTALESVALLRFELTADLLVWSFQSSQTGGQPNSDTS